MKKIFSILTLAVASLLTAQATQTVTITTTATNSTFGFRINKVNGSSTYKASNTRYAYTLTSGSRSGISTITEGTDYWTVVVTMNGNAAYDGAYLLTLSFPDDDLTFLEITSGQAQVATVNVSGSAATLSSLNLKGCTNLTTLTLGTMSVLADVNVANTRAAVANTFTAANCPALQNLNVAGCGLSSLAYTGTRLYSLDISSNNFTTLDLATQTSLDILRCESNSSLTTLKVPASLTTLSAQNSGLTSVTGYGDNLLVFDVAANALTTLSVEEMVHATDLDVSGNHLTFRSLPSAENKPARIIYQDNDGQYSITGDMRPAFGSYSYPLQSRLPNFSSRTDADYTIDLSDELLDGNGNKRVSVGFVNGSGSDLTQAVSAVDGNDYTVDTGNDLYGFMKTQAQVRAKFTNTEYPLLTLYSDYFTVPDGVSGTLKIVDEDGSTLFTKDNAFFSDANDGLPDYAIRDYTKYTIPAMPTTEGATWTITAGPSDDAPFAWAKSYGSAVWYYLGMKGTKWVTAGEQIYGLDAAYGYNGYSLKDSYDSNDDNYYWAFVGNQYDGFRIVNKNRGETYALQDYSGQSVPDLNWSAAAFPVLTTRNTNTWIVCTNTAGTGFSLKNKNGAKDIYGASAPCFLNDYNNLGALNYWVTNEYDSQNGVGSLFHVTKAADPLSAVVKWIIVDGSDNGIYTVVTDVERGTTVSSYPTALTTLAAERFVTLPSLTAFTVDAATVEKRIGYTWTGPFQISTEGNEHHYKLKIRNALFVVSNTMSNGALDCVSTEDTSNPYRWMFFGDPFNGFIIRNFAKGSQALCAVNGTATDGTSYPTFADGATRWIITTCTQAGYTNPFSVSPAGTSGVYWNQYGGINNNAGLKYWAANGTNDGGAAIQAIAIDEAVTSATITWNVVDADENVVFTTTKEYTLNTTVNAYPDELVALQDRFISYPSLSSFTASSSRSIDVPYSWAGPFELTTDINNPSLYRLKSARYASYVHAPLHGAVGGSPTHNSSSYSVSARDAWFFTGNPFDGIEIHTYANPTAGVSASWAISATPQKFIPRAAPDITTNYWENALPSAAIGFVVPGIAENVQGSCISESGALWYANSITSDKGCCFTVEAVDEEIILLPGYYRIRCVGTGLTSKYLTMTSSGVVQNSADDVDELSTKAFRLDEQDNTTWLISLTIDGTPYYLDNTRTSYSQQLTSTTEAANAFGCTITYNGKTGEVPFYAIKVGSFSSYDGYSYMNINKNGTGVLTWNYTSNTADGSAWALEPIAPTLHASGDANYASAYLPFDYTLPDGVEAYIVKVDGLKANPTSLKGKIIPAGTGVILSSDDLSQVKICYDASKTLADVSNNDLTGTYTDIVWNHATQGDVFVFSEKDGYVGFYKYQGNPTTTLHAYKAYLNPEVTQYIRGFIGFGYEGDETDTTGIDEVGATSSSDDTIYDLQGRRVVQPQKGNVYIVSGKKIRF